VRLHRCHWPGCDRVVPPAMWGCKPHWFRLPKFLRDAVWRWYVPGQELRKDPSTEYLDVAELVQHWCRKVGNAQPPPSAVERNVIEVMLVEQLCERRLAATSTS
jgi:hypothetical protein